MKLEYKIKMYLEDKGITQAFVCKKTGMSPVKLNLSLNGHRGMTFSEYELLCGALNLNTDYFLSPRLPEKEYLDCNLLEDARGTKNKELIKV